MKELFLGMVVKDTEGHPWVYVGRLVTPGLRSQHIFQMSVPHKRLTYPFYQFAGVRPETLINKFPELAEKKPAVLSELLRRIEA